MEVEHPEDAPVRVIFRTYRADGSVLAVFPDIPADDRGHVLSYQHIGQHGAASWGYVQAYTRPATPEEYAPLKRELEGEPYGYRLKVRRRR